MTLQKKVKGYVGSGLMLGVGSTVLGGMGQGAIASKVITPASNMMGPMISADLGMEVVNKFKTKKNKGGF